MSGGRCGRSSRTATGTGERSASDRSAGPRPPAREDGGMDAARQLAQVVDRTLDAVAGAVEQLARSRRPHRVDLLAGPPDVDAERRPVAAGRHRAGPARSGVAHHPGLRRGARARRAARRSGARSRAPAPTSPPGRPGGCSSRVRSRVPCRRGARRATPSSRPSWRTGYVRLAAGDVLVRRHRRDRGHPSGPGRPAGPAVQRRAVAHPHLGRRGPDAFGHHRAMRSISSSPRCAHRPRR